MRVWTVSGYERFYTIVVVCLWVIRGRDRGGSFWIRNEIDFGVSIETEFAIENEFYNFYRNRFQSWS